MKTLKMHCSNFKYIYDPVIDPLSPTCANCEFMPDNECGWGFEYLSECVFQLKPNTPYCYTLNRDDVTFSLSDDIDFLIDCIEASELRNMKPYWSSEEDILDFYRPYDSWSTGNFWKPRLSYNELLSREENGSNCFWSDYMRWVYSKEPCSRCGRVTEYFTVVGVGNKVLPELKLCRHCTYDQFLYDEFCNY